MREMRWSPPRGGAELLIDRPRLTACRLGGLGQTLISGDLDAAVAGLAPAAPMLGLYALLPAGAHALRIGRMSALLVTPAPLSVADGWRDGWCATGVDDGWAAVEVSGEDAAQAQPRPTSLPVRPRPPSLSLACAACSRARPPASASISRRRGWRRCAPGSTAFNTRPPASCHSRRLRSGRSGIQHKRRPSGEKGGFPLTREGHGSRCDYISFARQR
jgi:hypothetical protein